MALGHDHIVREGAAQHLTDRLVRGLVVGVLIVAFIAWLERSPIPALAVGTAVVVAVRAWHRAPWADGHHALAPAVHRAALLDDVDLMTSREFQDLVVRLLRRDGFGDVRPLGIRDDVSMDVLALTPAGRRVVVHCKRDDRHRRAGTCDVARFLDAVGGETDLAVLVTTGRFTRPALAVGERRDAVLLDRSQIAAWLTGRPTRLTPHLSIGA
jgi:hypothetical protein